MENNDVCVEIVTNKKYFIEDTIVISFKFNKKSLKPNYSDWIALYKCSSSKRNLEEFVAVETDLPIHSPTKHGVYDVIFHANQLKNVKCNLEYEFIYGNQFNEICGISRPLRFIHKNDCTFCFQNTSEINHCNCVSQELLNSLLSRMSTVDNQLIDCKIQSNEIISMNKCLKAQLTECEVALQNNKQFLDNLFYTSEPITKDGYRWMQPCTDTDLKTSLILSQEYELQSLSFQIADQIAHLKKLSEKSKEKDDINRFLTDMDTSILLDTTVNVESGIIPEPSTASFVFIDSDEDDV